MLFGVNHFQERAAARNPLVHSALPNGLFHRAKRVALHDETGSLASPGCPFRGARRREGSGAKGCVKKFQGEAGGQRKYSLSCPA